jgi:hypothetical protein
MANIVKINTVDVANIAKLNGVQPANFSKVLGQDFVTGYANSHSLSFDGTNDYATIGGTSDTYFGSGDWSLSWWMKYVDISSTSSSPSTIRGLFQKYESNSNYFALYFSRLNGTIFFNRKANNTNNPRNFNGVLIDDYTENTWGHFVLTNDKDGYMTMYVNSQQVGQQTGFSSHSGTGEAIEEGYSAQLQVGRFISIINSASFFDEIAIHHTALDSSNITAMYNSSTSDYTNGSAIDLSTNSGNYTQSSTLAHWWKVNNNGDNSAGTPTLSTVNGATFSTDTP